MDEQEEELSRFWHGKGIIEVPTLLPYAFDEDFLSELHKRGMYINSITDDEIQIRRINLKG